MRYLLILLFLVGCGEKQASVQPELYPYVYNIQQKIMEYTGVNYQINGLTFTIEDLEGLDGLYVGKEDKIIVDRDYFNAFRNKEYYIEAVLLHEIAHHLGMDHNDSFIDMNGELIPKSVSFYSALTIGAHFLENHEEYYYKELFTYTF